MRAIPVCFLSTLGLSWCLSYHSIQTQEPAELPTTTRPALDHDDAQNLRPLFYPGTHPNSLLSVFDNSVSGTTSFVEPASDADNSSISAWASPKLFTNLSAFNITHFASGRDNLEVVVGITPGVEDIVHTDDASSWELWTNASAMLQLFYPKDSVNPARWPQGGSEFYAKPLDIGRANNVTLEYRVFFPGDFDWVRGGKLPGLYGGHTRCSGGDPALDCFSTRMMWRAGGAGELYLVRPGHSLPARVLTSLCPSTRQKIGRPSPCVGHPLCRSVIIPMGSPLPEDLSHSRRERGHISARRLYSIRPESRTEASSSSSMAKLR